MINNTFQLISWKASSLFAEIRMKLALEIFLYQPMSGSGQCGFPHSVRPFNTDHYQ